MLVFSALSFLDPITEDLLFWGAGKGLNRDFSAAGERVPRTFFTCSRGSKVGGAGGKKGCAPTGRGAEEETFYRS